MNVVIASDFLLVVFKGVHSQKTISHANIRLGVNFLGALMAEVFVPELVHDMTMLMEWYITL